MMFNGKQTVHIGEGWKSTTDQYSNKGPIIIVESADGSELFRVLYDVVTGKLRVHIPSTGERIEVRLP